MASFYQDINNDNNDKDQDFDDKNPNSQKDQDYDGFKDYNLDDNGSEDHNFHHVPYENPYEKEYITSDEEQLDPNSISSVLACLKNNPLDEDLVEDLVNLLETNGHYDLACQMARICCEILSPGNRNMLYTIDRIARVHNPQLDAKLKSLWMTPQTYLHGPNLLVKEIVDGKYIEPGTGNHSQEVDLQGIVYHIDQIPSYPDTMIVIPSNADYQIVRKFHVAPFQIYNLQIKYACSVNLDVSLQVNTEMGDNKLTYKLTGSQIQYNFNSLDQTVLEIGLKGHSRPGNVGQLRLMELMIVRREYNFNLIDKDLKNRWLSGNNMPVVANLYVTRTDSMEGIRATLDCMINQVDIVNIYLNNLVRDELLKIEILLHSAKYRVKQGNDGRFGLWQMSTEIIGYQFMIEAGIVYDDKYVTYMLSKLLQYGNKVVVGLNGHQLMADYIEWSKSKKTYSNIIPLDQDIRCHIMGINSCAFLSGVVGNILDMGVVMNLLLMPGEMDDKIVKLTDDEVMLLFAIMAQRAKVGMICVERSNKLIKYSSRDETKMSDEIGLVSETLIKTAQPWKYY